MLYLPGFNARQQDQPADNACGACMAGGSQLNTVKFRLRNGSADIRPEQRNLRSHPL
ncbi:hypothetical protein HRbin36_01259 [bacterium HR36]|nr:hypothetical protein HRbin36_01259 [bacterium HR36]